MNSEATETRAGALEDQADQMRANVQVTTEKMEENAENK